MPLLFQETAGVCWAWCTASMHHFRKNKIIKIGLDSNESNCSLAHRTITIRLESNQSYDDIHMIVESNRMIAHRAHNESLIATGASDDGDEFIRIHSTTHKSQDPFNYSTLI